MEREHSLCLILRVFGRQRDRADLAVKIALSEHILVVVYCFENDIDLDTLLCNAEDAFERFAGAENAEHWIV